MTCAPQFVQCTAASLVCVRPPVSTCPAPRAPGTCGDPTRAMPSVGRSGAEGAAGVGAVRRRPGRGRGRAVGGSRDHHQSATARALGGPEMRENFATRILVRYTLNVRRMLVPQVTSAPKPTRHPGRVQVVLGGIAHETQVLNLTDAEARQWAMSGVHVTAGTTLHKRLPAVSAPVLVPSGADEDAPAPLPTPEDVLPAAVQTPWPDPAPAGDPEPPPTPVAGGHRHRAAPGSAAPARHHPRCAGLGPRQRPGLPDLRRQARRRTSLPRRRHQEVGVQQGPAPPRHPTWTDRLGPRRPRTGPVRSGRHDPLVLENTRHSTEKEHRTMTNTIALPVAGGRAPVRARGPRREPVAGSLTWASPF